MSVGYFADSFDVLNVRDLDLIAHARELCSRLLVGVFTDDYVERLRGRRPVVPLDERMALMQHIGGAADVVRMTRRYVLGRSRTHGNVHARIDLELSKAGAMRVRTRIRRGLIGTALLLVGATRWLVGLASRSLHHQARGLRMLMRGVGMIEAVFGLVHQEYERKENLEHVSAGAHS
jgi:hypothetical protein